MTHLWRALLAALLALAPLTALAGGSASWGDGGELAAPRGSALEAPGVAAHPPGLPPLLGVDRDAPGGGSAGSPAAPARASARAIDFHALRSPGDGGPAVSCCRPHAERLPYDALAPPHRG